MFFFDALGAKDEKEGKADVRQGTSLIFRETFHLVDIQEMHTNSWHSCSRNYIRRFLANVNINLFY